MEPDQPNPQNFSEPEQQIPAAQTTPWASPAAPTENPGPQAPVQPTVEYPSPPQSALAPNPVAVPKPAAPPTNVLNVGAVAVTNSDSAELEPGEELVDVVHRHPIGIVGIYAEMLTGIAGILALVLLAIFVFFASATSGTKGLIAAGGIFVIAFMIGILFIATYVYRQCRLLVTNKSLVQIIQKALFSKKISRLSMSNVEDVNVEQHGLLPTIFKYGTLTIQTAGEEDNFVFTLCPNPDKIAHQILEARQAYVRHTTD